MLLVRQGQDRQSLEETPLERKDGTSVNVRMLTGYRVPTHWHSPGLGPAKIGELLWLLKCSEAILEIQEK